MVTPSRRVTIQQRASVVTPELSFACRAGEMLLRLDLHERNARHAAGREGGEIDLEIIGVEAHRHVEQESRAHGSARAGHVARQKCHDPAATSQVNATFSVCSTPPTATRTVPATGFTIGRW